MPTKIGHFEILSELAKSATGAVYKATDPQTSQTVALKTIQLSAFGESAAELERSLLAEAEATKVLSHSNVTCVFGAGEIDGQFCAAMEYIQGNSIATMLANNEGFSIWDLLDIGRQVCGGLDHAHSHKVFHASLEPAKIMCGWDSMVRILGYGVSSVGKFSASMPGLPSFLPYISPEQIRGENIDARSNFFSLGAMFYEMVTNQKPFAAEDAASLRQNILQNTPVPPVQLNPKLHPILSDLIMRTLSKDPAERYQSGRELLDELEKCKETKPQAAKVAAPAKSSVPAAVKSATQAKFIAPVTAPAAAKVPLSQPAERKIAAPVAPSPARVTATAAGASGLATSNPQAKSVKAATPSASMASFTVDPPRPEAPASNAPRIAVDPMMAESATATSGKLSFSELTELPPLKEVYTPPPPPPPSASFDSKSQHGLGSTTFNEHQQEEKPKFQPREAAQKAVKEIKNVPPSLMIYAIAGAAVVILIIAVVLVLHVNSLNSDGDTSRPTVAETKTSAPAVPPQSAAQQAAPSPVQQTEQFAEPQAEPEPIGAGAASAKGKSSRKKAVGPVAPVVVPGQIAIDSTPQGAQVSIDGKSDPSWVTPFTLSGLSAGQHSVTIARAGYSPDTRTVDISSGAKAFVASRLAQLVATLAVTSTPAGANVFVDGKNSGKLTPAQVAVDQGQHVILVRKSGFIDETTSAQFTLGQTTNYAPALRALGNVDDIKTVGKMKMKFFGGKDAQGQGTVSVRTNPKGAQIAVNQHMLEKDSPVEFMLDPGNYIVDITMSGYAPVHKVISVDKGGKAVIDEVMQHD
jgi:eukaryotic-like serine/threonine-protein kinase